uniref:Uncharacterized protein n=1 Tax=Setaria italica TaxID=4555 RepID=K3XNN0_SETIT
MPLSFIFLKKRKELRETRNELESCHGNLHYTGPRSRVLADGLPVDKSPYIRIISSLCIAQKDGKLKFSKESTKYNELSSAVQISFFLEGTLVT